MLSKPSVKMRGGVFLVGDSDKRIVTVTYGRRTPDGGCLGRIKSLQAVPKESPLECLDAFRTCLSQMSVKKCLHLGKIKPFQWEFFSF